MQLSFRSFYTEIGLSLELRALHQIPKGASLYEARRLRAAFFGPGSPGVHTPGEHDPGSSKSRCGLTTWHFDYRKAPWRCSTGLFHAPLPASAPLSSPSRLLIKFRAGLRYMVIGGRTPPTGQSHFALRSVRRPTAEALLRVTCAALRARAHSSRAALSCPTGHQLGRCVGRTIPSSEGIFLCGSAVLSTTERE